MKTHGLLRGILAVGTVAVLLAQAPAAQAATITWSPTAAGTYNWNTNANPPWVGAVFPNSSGTTATVSLNIAGAQTINLNVPITIQNMTFGDSSNSGNAWYSMSIVGNGGSFIFENSGGATFTLTGVGQSAAGDSIAADILLNDDLTVGLASANTVLTLSGNITTSTGKVLTKTGSGRLVLTGSNSFASTTMSGTGTLAVNSNAALGAVPVSPTTNLSLSGGSTLRFDASMTVDSNRGIALGASGATLDTQGNNVVYLGAFSGTTTLTKAGTGRLTLASGMTQPLTITGGVVRVPASSWTSGKIALNDAAATGADATSVLETSGTFNRSLTGGTAFSMNAGGGGFAAYGGTLTVDLGTLGTREEWKWNYGAGADSYFLRDGRPLVLGSTTADNVVEWYDGLDLAGTSGAAQSLRQIKVIDNPGSTADRGKIGGVIKVTDGNYTKGLEKIGDGVLEIASASTYNGPTTVTAGTLLVNGSLSNLTGAVTVASGATLGGTGTISRPVTISAGGTLAPGDSAGTLHIVGTLSLAGDALFEINGTSAGQFDRIVDVTALTYGGTLTIKTASMLGKFDLDLFDFTSQSGSFTAITDAGGHYAPGQLSMNYSSGILSAVPEPATMALMGLGGLCMGLARMRERKRRAA